MRRKGKAAGVATPTIEATDTARASRRAMGHGCVGHACLLWDQTASLTPKRPGYGRPAKERKPVRGAADGQGHACPTHTRHSMHMLTKPPCRTVVVRPRYGHEHAAVDLQQEAVYGLTEVYRDAVKGARLLANPGCYPTCSQLPLYPLIKVGRVRKRAFGKGLVAERWHWAQRQGDTGS